MSPSVKPPPRHQCLLHDGASPRQLSAVATVMRTKLQQNYRCIYLDSPIMIAGMQCYLEAAGIPLERYVAEKRLLLSSDQKHLAGGHFDPERMMRTLEIAYQQALNDGFEGLWASGDMGWEIGPRMDHSSLWDYERELERFLCANPRFSGICQYHVGTLPREAVRHGLLAHQSIFVSENLSMINPYFLESESPLDKAAHPILLDAAIGRLCDL